MIPFDKVMMPLSAVLGLSLVVERLLELGKNLLKPAIGAKNLRPIPEPSTTTCLSSGHGNEAEMQECFNRSTVLVETATCLDDDTTLRTLVLQLLGFAGGIILTRCANVHLFSVFLNLAPEQLWLDYILTGLLIGGGSGPVHILIRFISERKITTEEQAAHGENKPAPLSPAVSHAPAILTSSQTTVPDWQEIPYDGGIDREKLEAIHRRDDDPRMIVYHHTAMSSRSTFDDVVRVIKSRTDCNGNHWSTGYHCVVTADGSIHPFCRWDRYGCHAAGYNKESLGIAFNGNFEPDRQVPFSNPDGRYGPVRPTEAQLRAGARVVALWACLYGNSLEIRNGNIAALFKNEAIRPHSRVPDSRKTCPGAAFPKQEFENWIGYYYRLWQGPAYQQRLEAYALKPYLFSGKKGA